MTNRRFKEIIEKIVISPIFISFFVFIIAAVIVYKLTISKVQEAYNDIFIRDVLVEAHGMLFDILIIGTFIFALHELVEKRHERKSKIKRWQEEIDDYRGWDEKEAMIKIVGNIKRLNRNGITKINLLSCYLRGADLNGADFRGADLSAAVLSWADLDEADLNGADLNGADLSEADLSEANLNGADLSVVDFNGADLRGTKKITIEQLSEVETLYKAKLDPEIEKQIIEKYPHLLEAPK